MTNRKPPINNFLMMFRRCFQLFLILLLTAIISICVNAQFNNPNDPRKEEIPQGIKENLAKQRIEREKKEYAKLIERGEETLKLSQALRKSAETNNTISSDDRKKLDQIEKLIKRIRTDLGGDDDEESDVSNENEPLTMANAFKILEENAVKLVEELKISTRYTISASAIRNTNFILKIVKFVRVNN
ncbi:hypothetical protein BH10ACI1_BH10ACI1_03230 [soil metagenome]